MFEFCLQCMELHKTPLFIGFDALLYSNQSFQNCKITKAQYYCCTVCVELLLSIIFQVYIRCRVCSPIADLALNSPKKFILFCTVKVELMAQSVSIGVSRVEFKCHLLPVAPPLEITIYSDRADIKHLLLQNINNNNHHLHTFLNLYLLNPNRINRTQAQALASIIVHFTNY